MTFINPYVSTVQNVPMKSSKNHQIHIQTSNPETNNVSANSLDALAAYNQPCINQHNTKEDINYNQERITDNTLQPHAPFAKIDNPMHANGKKTYYANGLVKTNTVLQDAKEVTYHFLENGILRNATFDNVVVEYGDVEEDGYEIHEMLDGGIEKHTSYIGNEVTVYTNME